MRNLSKGDTNEYPYKQTICKLDNGKIIEYDACASIKDKISGKERTPEEIYDPNIFEYIGTGVLYQVGDTLQNSTVREYFYIKK